MEAEAAGTALAITSWLASSTVPDSPRRWPDLLTADEEQADAATGQYRFDIGKLAVRVIAVTDWLVGHDTTAGLGVGLFGASTGAAAALIAAAARPFTVEAVVSRGGRPDLAGEFLRLVYQPTQLIVGGRDATVLELNRAAARAASRSDSPRGRARRDAPL
jgi:dienelactone hydrolase